VSSRYSHNPEVIAAFRSAVDDAGRLHNGRPLLLLTTKGARSGSPHTAPMRFLEEGGRFFVFASNSGEPSNPDWYRNLVANPRVTVEVGGETFTATAGTLAEPERSRIYARQVVEYPNFAEFPDRTTRQIPVVELVRDPS
jgi:deazaflavin-dependent oxidoreductase (nitroreductase family)